MYTTWAASPEFKESLKHWLSENSDKVQFFRLPSIAAGMPHARLQARTFFTLEQLGHDDLQEAMDAWVQSAPHIAVYHNIWTPSEKKILDLNLTFARLHGISPHRFVKTYYSKAVSEKVRDAEIDSSSYLVLGTPTFVINRRYSVSPQRLSFPNTVRPKDLTRLLELIDCLAKSEMRVNGLTQ